MKKTVRIIAIAMLMLVVLSALACGKKEDTAPASESAVAASSVEDLWGTWKGIDGEISTVSFAKSGAYRDDAGDGLYVAGTYKVDEAAQTIIVNESEYGMVFEYHFTIDGNVLTMQLDGGKARKFVK